MKNKKKHKRRHRHAQGTAPSFQPLTGAEYTEMRESVINDFKKTRMFGRKEPLLVENRGGEKMSEVLVKFARPWLDEYGADDQDTRNIITLAVCGWNLALVPPGEQGAMVRKALRVFPASDRPIAEKLLAAMVERKQRHFKGIRRLIVNYKAEIIDEDISLFVASTPTAEQAAQIEDSFADHRENGSEGAGQQKHLDARSPGVVGRLLSKLPWRAGRGKALT